MTHTKDEALKLALEALKLIRRQLKSWDEGDKAIAAIKKSLAAQPAPVQEGWKLVPVVATREIEDAIGKARNLKASEIWEDALAATPLAAPVTDTEQINSGCWYKTDLTAAQPAPVQERIDLQFLRQVVGVAIAGLFEHYKEDVARVFDTSTLQDVAEETMNLGDQRVEEIYKRAWDMLNTAPPAAQPAVPDAFGTREGEHPQYIEGWNDCRAEMLKGMKP